RSHTAIRMPPTQTSALFPCTPLFRALFSLVALLIMLKPAERNLNANGLWPIHGARAVLKLAGLVFYFMAITMLPIALVTAVAFRSEEHTSELQSREKLVCRLPLE